MPAQAGIHDFLLGLRFANMSQKQTPAQAAAHPGSVK